jgi:hypothetical protein
MDFFLPSLIVLILSAIIVFTFLPRLGPIILLLMSGGLLGFGIYHHYSLFENEYRFSTWQDQLKIYGPGVVIGVTVLFLIGFILSFFGGPSVPVPPMPEMPEMPNIQESAPVQAAVNTFNSVKNTVENTFNSLLNRNESNNMNRNRATPAPEPVPAPASVATPVNNRNRNRRNIRQSFFEEI